MRRFILVVVLLFSQSHISGAQTNNWILGLNWATFNRTLNYGAMHRLFDSTIGFNFYHGDGPLNGNAAQKDTSVIGWSQHSSGKVVFRYNNSALNTYSGAERIQLVAHSSRITGVDSLKYFYFLHRGAGSQYVDPYTSEAYWSIDSSSVHLDTCSLSGNEFPRESRNGSDVKFVVATRLHVAAIHRTSSDTAVLIKVIHFRRFNERDSAGVHLSDSSYTTIASYGIRRDLFTQPNADTVLISDTFSLSHPFRYFHDSLLVEVHSQRHGTTRIAWVTVEDVLARDLMTYHDLPEASDTTLIAYWRAKHDTIVGTILDEKRTIEDSLGNGNPAWFYLNDEPPVSELQCSGEVNAIIGHRGITEIGGPENKRFLKFVQPNILWSGGFSTGGQVCAYLDTGYHNYFPQTDSINGYGVYPDSSH